MENERERSHESIVPIFTVLRVSEKLKRQFIGIYRKWFGNLVTRKSRKVVAVLFTL